MSGPDFFQTVMGHRFYEVEVPRISRSLDRIASALEKIVARMDAEESSTNILREIADGVKSLAYDTKRQNEDRGIL